MNEIAKIYKYMCPFCRRREATLFCDFVVDYPGTLFASGKNGFIESWQQTCNAQMCTDCAHKVNGAHDFCPDCNKLHLYVQQAYQKNKSKEKLRMYVDSILEEDTHERD